MALGLVYGRDRDQLDDWSSYIRSLPCARRFCSVDWEAMAMDLKSPLATVADFIECVNHADLERLNSYISPEIVFTDIQGRVYSEPEFMVNYLRAYPDYRINVEHVLQGGEGVAVIGSTSGSHVSPDIEANEILVWTAEVRDGLITAWRIYSTKGYASSS